MTRSFTEERIVGAKSVQPAHMALPVSGLHSVVHALHKFSLLCCYNLQVKG